MTDVEENPVTGDTTLRYTFSAEDLADLTTDTYTVNVYQQGCAAYPVAVGTFAVSNDLYVLHFYHHDHLGTVRSITDKDGIVVSTHEHAAYGEELSEPEFDTNRMKFTGHERDPETNLDYMLARYYASKPGTFLQPDPGYDYDPMDPMSWNLYGYVRGNPVMGVDPSGESYLVFNGAQQRLTLYSYEGIVLGSWRAANNVASTCSGKPSKGKWEDGVYYFKENPVMPISEADKKAGKDESMGPNGRLAVLDFVQTDGLTRTLMRLHAGRDKVTDWTCGCIRTVDDAIKLSIETHERGDELEYLVVEDNKPIDEENQAARNRRDPFTPPPAHTLRSDNGIPNIYAVGSTGIFARVGGRYVNLLSLKKAMQEAQK